MTTQHLPLPRILTGIRASGQLHIGNYLAAVKPAVARQQGNELFLFIADLHALTTVKEPQKLREATYDVIATYLAAGLDHTRHAIYLQSDIPTVTELAWYLSCVTGVGFLEKGHAYKDALASQREVNHGVLYYPVLMAADIMLYEADIVPVGKDQKQHVEMARDFAGSFNAVYGDVLKLPTAHIDESVMTVLGLDGRKMSKSYDNTIPVFCDSATLRKKVMSIKTDSTPLEAPKTLQGTLVGDLFTLFASREEWIDLASRLAAGGMGWGHAKDELFQAMNRELTAPRERYESYRADEPFLRQVVGEGADRARAVADRVIGRVREAVGVLGRS
jgi:tryptophanyl-tRNA synthetase